MGYSFGLTARFFYMHHPTDRIAHATAFVTPVVEHWSQKVLKSTSTVKNVPVHTKTGQNTYL